MIWDRIKGREGEVCGRWVIVVGVIGELKDETKLGKVRDRVL